MIQIEMQYKIISQGEVESFSRGYGAKRDRTSGYSETEYRISAESRNMLLKSFWCQGRSTDDFNSRKIAYEMGRDTVDFREWLEDQVLMVDFLPKKVEEFSSDFVGIPTNQKDTTLLVVPEILPKRKEAEADVIDSVTEPQITFVKGDSVKITDGQFNGFKGVIESVNGDDLTITVRCAGKNKTILLTSEQVEL